MTALGIMASGYQVAAPPAGITDDFNRANATLTTPWVNIENIHSIVSNKVPVGTGSPTCSYYDQALTSDQWAEADLAGMSLTGGSTIAPCVRYNPSSGSTYYLWTDVTGHIQINKRLSGVYSTLATGAVVPTTFRGKIEVIGTTLRAYVDGVLALTATDSSIASGLGGIISANGGGATLDNFAAGPLAAGIVITDRGTHQVGPGPGSVTMSKTSSAFSPAAGTILVLGVNVTGLNITNTQDWNIVVTDNIGDTGGGVWVKQNVSTRGAVPNGAQMEHIETWTRIIGATPGASKTITCTATGAVGGQTAMSDGWVAFHYWEVAGQHASPIGLKVGNTPVTSGTTLTTNLGGVPVASSAVFGHVMSDFGNQTPLTQPTGWTESDDQPLYMGSFEWAYKNGSSVQSPQWSGFTSGERLLGCAIEIKAA